MARLEKYLLMLLGVILGLTAASCTDGHHPVAEYGMPHADYGVSGKVQDVNTGLPIPGITVTFTVNQPRTATTAADGTFSILFTEGLGWPAPYHVMAQDTDGAVNGAYQTLTVQVTPVQTAPASGYYYGKFEKRDLVLALTPAP
jgi:putative lipoprotein (rSAM/lipoprotein system)